MNTQTNNFTSSNFLSSSNNISSLSNVDKKAMEMRKAKIFLISMFFMILAVIALITSIIVVAIKTNTEQKSLLELQNKVDSFNIQIENLEKNIDKKYQNVDFEKEAGLIELNNKYGKVINMNDSIGDVSIAINKRSDNFNSFMSTIVNNLNKLWDFFN